MRQARHVLREAIERVGFYMVPDHEWCTPTAQMHERFDPARVPFFLRKQEDDGRANDLALAQLGNCTDARKYRP